jgi:hypothetical protein
MTERRTVVAIGAALAALVLILASVLQADLSPAANLGPPTIGGCDVFPASSASPRAKSAGDQTAWNQDVSRAPVARNSARIIRRLNGGGTEFLHPDFGSNPNYGIPYEVVDESQPNVQVQIGPDGYPDESDFGPAPIPPQPPTDIEGGSDHHVLVVQRGSCGLYELYRAEQRGNSGWQADATAFFDLTRSGPLRHDGYTSADAAGLPILPGLVRYDEVAAGRLSHAIRVTFAQTRRAYVHPATHYASSECSASLPPMGLRMRMKRSYFKAHLSGYPQGSESRVIFTALFHYGFIVADNGSDWYFSGSTDPRWNDNDLNRLKRIPGTAFQVIQSASKTKTAC